MAATVAASPRQAKYAAVVDRESAREKLAARLEAGAAKEEAERSVPAPAKPKPRAKPAKQEDGLVEQVVRDGTGGAADTGTHPPPAGRLSTCAAASGRQPESCRPATRRSPAWSPSS